MNLKEFSKIKIEFGIGNIWKYTCEHGGEFIGMWVSIDEFLT